MFFPFLTIIFRTRTNFLLEKIDEKERTSTEKVEKNLPDVPAAAIGPSLPPGFVRPARIEEPVKRVVGPTLPSDLSTLGASYVHTEAEDEDEDENEDDGVLVGPSLSQMASASDYSAVDEVAERFARKAEKLRKAQEPVAPARESWMTDLPESLLGRNALPTMPLGARTFKRKTDDYEADFSGWTTGPDGEKRKAPEEKDNSLEVLQYEQALQRERKLELEIEANNRKKRGEALVTMVKKSKAPEETVERRPFDRERDLNIRKTVNLNADEVSKRAAALKEKFATSSKAGQKFLWICWSVLFKVSYFIEINPNHSSALLTATVQIDFGVFQSHTMVVLDWLIDWLIVLLFGRLIDWLCLAHTSGACYGQKWANGRSQG